MASSNIFSQAAQAVAEPNAGDPAPLGDLTDHISALVTYGASQSGGRLITYVNAVHPDADVFDGFLILVANNGAPLAQAPLPAVPVPGGANSRIRSDSADPVLHVNTETEFVASARGLHSQPDGDRFHLWEITGAAHATRPGIEAGNAKRVKNGLPVGLPPCGVPSLQINDMDVSVVVKAGLHRLWKWVEHGWAPVSAPRVELTIPADPTQPATIVRDASTGIARGGLRVPDVEAPIRTLWGVRPPADLALSPACFLFGAVDPWNGDTDGYDGNASFDLTPTPEPSPSALYRKRFRYVSAVSISAIRNVLLGYLLPHEAIEIIQKAMTVELH